MDTLTIILIVLTVVVLIANIVMFMIERTEKHELNFDKTKVKIMLFASEDEHELVKSEVEMTNKYYVLDSAAGNLKTEHGNIYIRAHIVEKK